MFSCQAAHFLFPGFCRLILGRYKTAEIIWIGLPISEILFAPITLL